MEGANEERWTGAIEGGISELFRERSGVFQRRGYMGASSVVEEPRRGPGNVYRPRTRDCASRGGGPWNAQPRPISPDLQVIIVLQAPQTKRKHAYGTRQPTQLTMRCANTVLCCPMLCALLVDSSMCRRGNATTATADNCLVFADATGR